MPASVAMPAVRQNRSKRAPTCCQASSTIAAGATPAAVVDFVMALLSFADSAPRAYRLKVGNAYLTFSTSTGASPRVLLGQVALDLPQYLLPARRVALHRLLLDQLVDIVVAIAVPVDAGAAAIDQIEDRIGIRAAGLQVEADRVFLAHDLRVVAGGVDRLEFGFDVNLPQLIDQDDRRVAVEADI